MLNVIVGMLDLFFTYLYYVDGKYLPAIIWAILGTINIALGFVTYEWRK